MIMQRAIRRGGRPRPPICIKLSAIWVVGRHRAVVGRRRAAVCRRLRGHHRPGFLLSTRGGGPLGCARARPTNADAVEERLLTLMPMGPIAHGPHEMRTREGKST